MTPRSLIRRGSPHVRLRTNSNCQAAEPGPDAVEKRHCDDPEHGCVPPDQTRAMACDNDEREHQCQVRHGNTPPATLSPASRALVSQAQAQRQKGDLPGATVSLERALRIEPSNPLLWIEMGRLRMDQRNYPQAENMARKALSMSVGDDRTQAAAWQLVGDSLKARGNNPQAQAAYDRAKALVVN